MAVHPNSLANLQPGRSNPMYSVPKKRHNITVTEEGWNAVKNSIIVELGLSSVSELLEHIGRGKIKLVKIENQEE